MSNNKSYLPEPVETFAMKIIRRLHLDQASTMAFVSTIIREAVYEERKTVHMREAVCCFGCGILLLRYQALNERYCSRCPACREPMLTQEELYRKKFHLLEEKVRQA